jgi:hypothetical protein
MRTGKELADIDIYNSGDCKPITEAALRNMARALAVSVRAEARDSVIIHTDKKTWEAKASTDIGMDGREHGIEWSEWKRVKE